jgi:ATP-binding cassette, sub-family E, member 1
VVKPQYVDQLPKAVKQADRTVGGLLRARKQLDNYDEIIDVLGKEIFSGSTRTGEG